MDNVTAHGMPAQKRNGMILLVTIFTTYLFYGFLGGIRGPALPRIQEDFGLTEFQLGLMLAANSLGYLISCSNTATLAKKIGIKTCLIISLVIFIISGFCICFSPSYITLVLSFFILNLGNGIMEVSQGVIAATIFTKNTGTMMSLSHFFYGAGSTISPIISTSIMVARFGETILSWRYLYLIVLSWSLIPIILALFGRFEIQNRENRKSSWTSLLKKPTFLLVVLVLALASVCEIGIGSWLVNFLEKAYSYTSEQAALQLTLFFVCMTLPRLIIGPIIDRIGLINSISIVTALTGIVIVTGVLWGESGTILFVLAGVCMSPFYPTMMAVVAKLFPDDISDAMTVLMTVTGMFIVIANLTLGGIIQLTRAIFTNIYGEAGVGKAFASGFLFLSLCCFGAFLLALILRSKQKKAGNLV